MPEWLSVSPASNLLMPGEICVVNLIALVEAAHAAELNEAAAALGRAASGEDDSAAGASTADAGHNPWTVDLDAILLLRLHHGRDYYLSVQARWTASCLGNRLSNKMTIGWPIRSRHSTRAPPRSVDGNAPAAVALPSEVVVLLSALDDVVTAARMAADAAIQAATKAMALAQTGHGVVLAGATNADATSAGAQDEGTPAEVTSGTDVTGNGECAREGKEALLASVSAAAAAASEAASGLTTIFLDSEPDTATCDAVLDAIEVSTLIPSGVAPSAVGAVLLRWCAALADSVVPSELFKAAEAATPSKAAAAALMCSLPDEHFHVFEAIVLFLRRLLRTHAAAAAAAASAAAAVTATMKADSTLETKEDTLPARTNELSQVLPEYMGELSQVDGVLARRPPPPPTPPPPPPPPDAAGRSSAASTDAGESPDSVRPSKELLHSRLAGLFGEALIRQPVLEQKGSRRPQCSTSTMQQLDTGASRTAPKSPSYLIGAQWWKAVFMAHFLGELTADDQQLGWRARAS